MGALEQDEQFREHVEGMSDDERDEKQADLEWQVKNALRRTSKREAQELLEAFLIASGRNGNGRSGNGASAMANRMAIAGTRRRLEQSRQNGNGRKPEKA